MKKAYDRMDGHTFEHYCAGLLRKNGFHHVEVTRGSGDQGIDILAWKHRKKYGIQCKCYSYYLGNKAIQEAYAGMKFYECDVAAVLTNQYFTNSAVALSEKTDVLLWNRSVLEELRKCKKPRLLNLAGLLGMAGSAWLFYFLCSAEGLEAIRHLPELTDCMFCAFLFLGSFLLFLEKGSFFLSFLATLLLGSSVLVGFCLLGNMGGIVLVPLLLFFFSLFRSRKLKHRTHAQQLLPKRTEKSEK